MSPFRCPPGNGVVRRFFILALSIPVVSCAPSLYPAPINPETNPTVLIDRMLTRQAGLHALSATGRVESRTVDGTLKGRVTLLADIKGRLRVDAWTSTDNLVGAVSAGPEGFTYFQRGGACLVGDACRSNLGRVLPKGWDLDSLVHGLLGIPPMVQAAGPWIIDFDRRIGAYRLESKIAGGGVQRVWIRDNGAPLRYERDDHRRTAVRLDIPETAGEAGMPARIVSLRSGRGETELTIRYSDLETNPDIDAADWILECPPGPDAVFLPCEGEP